MKLVTKNNKKYMHISKMTLDFDIKGYNIEFFKGTESNQWIEIIRNFVMDNQKEILKTIIPILQETVSKRIILLTNDTLKHFTYEELFPDRT